MGLLEKTSGEIYIDAEYRIFKWRRFPVIRIRFNVDLVELSSTDKLYTFTSKFFHFLFNSLRRKLSDFNEILC